MPGTATERVNGISTSAAVKVAVVAASTGNLLLEGEQTVNGVPVVTGDRVLVKNQTDPTENGIYDVDTSDWSRSLDFEGNRDVRDGTMVLVLAAGGGAGELWQVDTSDPITIGNTSIAFVQLI
jgi:hypothetical protein